MALTFPSRPPVFRMKRDLAFRYQIIPLLSRLLAVFIPSPFTLIAPPDMKLRAHGENTTVNDLGKPELLGKVNSPLNITNDRPAMFPIGRTIVTWTATDETWTHF